MGTGEPNRSENERQKIAEGYRTQIITTIRERLQAMEVESRERAEDESTSLGHEADEEAGLKLAFNSVARGESNRADAVLKHYLPLNLHQAIDALVAYDAEHYGKK